MAGYSGTPLAKKLGIKENSRILVVGAPEDYHALLEPLPTLVQFVSKPDASTNIVHLFTRNRSELSQALGHYRTKLSSEAVV